ncbi:MAG: tetratricopeptide repeat protein, partial [Acidobacteriota bacterium]
MARHSHIAAIVFNEILHDPEKRYDHLVRILGEMNINYSSDLKAFRNLTRGRSVIETFASVELGRKFYDQAQKVAKRDPYLLHQRGIFEMNHFGGSSDRAEEHLRDANELASYDKSIQHSLGNLARRQALTSDNSLQREKLRSRARQILSNLTGLDARTSHGFQTLALLGIDELRDVLSRVPESGPDDLIQRQIVDLSRDVESTLSHGLQKFPDEPELLATEADFRTLMDQNRMAEMALRRAFDRNPRLDWIAIRLASQLAKRGQVAEAKDVLRQCVQDNPSSKPANLALAKTYIQDGTQEEKDKVLAILRRSFT